MNFNLFWVNIPFLYPHEIMKKHFGFVLFSVGIQRNISLTWITEKKKQKLLRAAIFFVLAELTCIMHYLFRFIMLKHVLGRNVE